ncbi:MAG: hypothetical protein L0H54_01430 [Alcaligenaceae bacterium]|nr:hypothetical protein [Alcaligenaceae bacterium]
MKPGILIVGASGLIGQGVLTAALQDTSLGRIALLVRRPISTADVRVELLQADVFSDDRLGALDFTGLDACLYCAGPLPLGLSEAAYREVTLYMTMRVATAYAAANPQGRFLYLSGLGANAHSRIMPFRVKGEIEDALRTLNIPVCCLRPGGARPVQGEISPHAVRRWVYRLGDPILALCCMVAAGQFTTTRAIGRAMLQAARQTPMPAVVDHRAICAADQG